MKPIRAWLLATLAFVATFDASLLGQTEAGGHLRDYEITTWNESHGVPAGRIRAIRQDSHGYLWLATDVGLVRFDGVRFDLWTLKDPSFPSGPATALLTAHDRSIWVGLTGSSPVGRLRDRTLTLYGAREGFDGGYVSSLIEDREGTIWAATPQGLFYFRDERWQQAATREDLGNTPVLSIYEDRQGHLWVGTRAAVFRRTSASEPFQQIDVISVSSAMWQGFSEDASGAVWITDFRKGLRRPSIKAATVSQRGWGVDLLQDRRGNLWVGTQGQGLWQVRHDPGEAKPTVQTITVADGLASNAVQSIWEDRDGNIWLGTLAGLQRLTPHLVTPVKNLPIPRAIAATSDGSVWVGTAAGLTRYSNGGRRDYTEVDGLPGSLVMELHADDDGDLWVSTEGGVARFSEERFSPVLVRPDERVQRIFAMAGSRDMLWLLDVNARLFRRTGTTLAVPDDVPDEYRRGASSVFIDSRGNLWIGSVGGRLAVLDGHGDVRPYDLPLGRVVCIFEDAGGAIWVGGDDGLSYFRHGRWITATNANGFPGSVRAIVEDELGFIWVGARTGIVRLERDEIARTADDPNHQLRFRLFNSADGAAGAPFGDAARSNDGRLWFVTSSGVTVVDPRNLPEPRPTPRVRIETVTADARVFDPGPDLSLPARTSQLQFTFTALTLSDPTRVRFRYRLDGFDHDWVDGGSVRLASYTNLPPREYRFQVVASGGDGAWGVPGTLSFQIAPTFYQTRLFYVASAAFVFLTVYTAWRFRVRHVRREFELVLAERLRVSRAIHDTLLQGMAALALQVDDLSHSLDQSPASRSRAVRIRRQVEQYIRQARQSIWLLRSPAMNSRDLAQALREAAERATVDKPVDLQMAVSGTPRPCDPSLEEQVLLIGQEAINNAVRHAGAKRVAVELDYGADQVRLRVADDGCGFDTNRVSAIDGHYGLVSMRERADQLRGQFRIVSSPGSGTEVETVIPAPSRSFQ